MFNPSDAMAGQTSANQAAQYSGYMQYIPQQPYTGGVCPSCGSCPTCGRRTFGANPYPYWYRDGYSEPLYQYQGNDLRSAYQEHLHKEYTNGLKDI